MTSPPLSHKGFYHRGMALNFVTFNQDHSVLGVGTDKGFRQYSTEPFSKSYESQDGDVAIMEMLFSTSLVALVLSPRVLRIQNTKRQSIICELTFPQKILTVRMNRKRLVVVLEDAMYLYDISNMKMLHTIETSPNPHAICALSPSSENNYLIYPLPQKKAATSFNPPMHAPPAGTHVAPMKGDLLVFDALKLETVNVIEAHQTSLSCAALNNEGSLVATASEKGTIIRVFSVPDGQKLFQFRRGSIPARIYSMSFNVTSTLLCVSSATETVHIFRLISQNKNPDASSSLSNSPTEGRPPSAGSRDRSASPSSEDPRDSSVDVVPEGERRPLHPSWQSMLRRTSQNFGKSLVAAVGGYMPNAVTEMWEPARDFAWVKVPHTSTGASSGPLKSVVAMSSNHPQVMVATSEGFFYVYSIDLEKGGEGMLLDQRSLLETPRLGSSALDD